jgi:hypothetical protein
MVYGMLNLLNAGHSSLTQSVRSHRHTVEQYGVRVEISTKTHRISHSSTRSSLTGRSWPWFESTIHVRVSRCRPHVMHSRARCVRRCAGEKEHWLAGESSRGDP